MLSPSLAEDGWASRHSVIEIVNDDMPFLVDSTTMEINRQGLTLHLIVHPIFAVRARCAAAGCTCARACAREAPERARESWMHVEVDRLVDAQQRAELVAGIERVLGDVRAAVDDWKPMLARLQRGDRRARSRAGRRCRRRRWPRAAPSCNGWPTTTSRCSATGATTWSTSDGEDVLRLVPGSGLGVLREAAARAVVGQLRRAAAAGPRAGARAAAGAGGDQGQHPLHRAPPGLHRLRRRQALRRRAAR